MDILSLFGPVVYARPPASWRAAGICATDGWDYALINDRIKTGETAKKITLHPIMTFSWNNKYSVDIPLIDDQHRHFFELAGELRTAVDTKTWDRNRVLDLFKELVDYAEHHLETEERLFEEYGYPDAEKHCAEHYEYRGRTQGGWLAVRKPGADVSGLCTEMAEFTSTWLQEHILKVDMKYVGFFKKNGVNGLPAERL